MDRRRLILLILLGGCCTVWCMIAMPLGCLSETYQSELCWKIGCVLNWHGTGRDDCPPYRPPTTTGERPTPTAEPTRQVIRPVPTSPANESEPTSQVAVPESTGQQTMPEPALRRAMALLSEHDLHPIGDPGWLSDAFFDMSDDEWPSLKPFAETSQEVGLDMAAHDGRTVHLYGVWLQEQCQSDQGTISAFFAVSEDELIGAALLLSGYYGGPTALSDRSSFTIPGLAPDNLDFRTVHRVEVLGPWVDDGYQNVVELSSRKRADVLDILTSAELMEGNLQVDAEDREYVVALYPDNGGRIVARVSSDASAIEPRVTYTLGGFQDVYFVTEPRLLPLLQAALEP